MTEFVGYVECRLDLPQESTEFKSRKSTQVTKVSPSLWHRNNGLYFIPSHNMKEYLLVVPSELLKLAYDAARFKREVRVGHCQVVLVHLSKDSGATSEDTVFNTVEILEIGQLELIGDAMQISEPELQAWNLHQLRDLGKVNVEDRNLTVIGTIDAISPIISVVPSDPFSLAELYCPSIDGEDALSCLVVFQGIAALLCHDGILPGDTIIFNAVYHRQWAVPKALQHMKLEHIEVPRRVLVVKEASSIAWNVDKSEIPTVAISMSIVQGTVNQVNIMDGRFHFIELNEEGKTSIVFIQSFPMSLNLQYGLRQGAFVRAINVHILFANETLSFFGTCLRSTICIIRCASSTVFVPSKSINTYDLANISYCIPWRYSRIKVSSYFIALSTFLRNFADTNIVNPFISHENLVGAILKLYAISNIRQKEFTHISARCEEVSANSKKRDQFAEFLDHCSNRQYIDQFDKCGCHLSCFNGNSLPTPLLLTASKLKHSLFGILERRLSILVSNRGGRKIQGSSVVSFHLSNEDILQELEKFGYFPCIIGKFIRFSTTPDIYLLEDSVTSFPITARLPTFQHDYFANTFVLGYPEVYILSAMYLGELPAKFSNDVNESSTSYFPLRSFADKENTGLEGSCAVLKIQNHFFVASFHVHFKAISPILNSLGIPTEKDEANFNTVEHVLDPQRNVQPDLNTSGILCRQRFQFMRVKQGEFHGTILTMSQFSKYDKNEIDFDDVSTFQSIPVNIVIPLSDDATKAIMQGAQRLCPEAKRVLFEERCALAAAWCKLADSASSPVIACGFDELICPQENSLCSGVDRFLPVISSPYSTYSQGSQGYASLRCDMSNISVRLVRVRNIRFPKGTSSELNVTSLGSQPFPRGSMDRMLDRKLISDWALQYRDGLISMTIGDLYFEICTALRIGSQKPLAPSLVRLIPAARLMHVSYCKVQAECSMCHSALIRAKYDDKWQGVDETSTSYPCFWSVKSPPDCKEPSGMSRIKGKSLLVCPNDCPVEYGEIVWECKGILDDGTGQCQIFAERQTAHALLRLTPETLRIIDEEAWKIESGFHYQKGFGPSMFLATSIKKHLLMSNMPAIGMNRTTANTIDQLPPRAKAEYLLHQMCTNGVENEYEHDFLVRCKPLRPDAFRLNLSEIRTAKTKFSMNDTVVYSLPPLRVSLVNVT